MAHYFPSFRKASYEHHVRFISVCVLFTIKRVAVFDIALPAALVVRIRNNFLSSPRKEVTLHLSHCLEIYCVTRA